MNDIKHLLRPMRPPFLVLAPACVVLGLGTAIWTSGKVNILYLIITLIGSIAAHISVNAFNEYFDFKSGLDARTERTPFSGGSGTLPAEPALARHTLGIALITFTVTGLIGLYFLQVRGLFLLPLGLLGLLLMFAYTPWMTRNPWLCLIAPGIGFGPLMVIGTHFVLTGKYSWTAFTASLVPFFLVNNLLLLNQFPDVEADRSVGRKNFPIIIGRQASSLIYGSFLLLAFVSITLGVYWGCLPKFCLIGWFSFVIAVPAFIGVHRYADHTERLLPYMRLNVVISIATPVLVAVGLLVR
jgi:1,4-dihydroxy-2-naphthoate octaprenyltransferase